MADDLRHGDGDRVVPSDRARPPRMPRWVKVSAAVAVIVVLVLLVMLLVGGPHSPRRHFSSAGPAATASQDGSVETRSDAG